MTCDEFRRICGIPRADTTRGERAAIFKHSSECEECIKWCDEQLDVTPAREKYAAWLTYLADMEDDEFRKTAHGPNCVGILFGMPLICQGEVY